jgi:shikimate dehydrogenase
VVDMAINGGTRIYAIIGDPISHVRSPGVYNALIAATGRDEVLVPWHAKPAGLDAVMKGLQATANVDGIIVTFPYKQAVLAFADTVRDRALQVGGANALRRDDAGHWIADMFDGVGLVRAVQGAGRDIAGISAWVIGAGGAGSAIAFALAAAGATALYVTDLDTDKAARVARDVARYYPATAVHAFEPDLSTVSLLINASTVGLNEGDGLPVNIPSLKPDVAVVDIVPRPGGTALLELAGRHGCLAIAGSSMVEGQAEAVLNFFWNG